jgi:SPP1 gp7 family putative phage head morphogenesis protein
MPTITDLAKQFRDAVDRQDAAALGRLARTYAQLYQRMTDKLDALLLAMSKLEEPTKGQVMRLAQYKNLMTSLENELTKYAAYVEIEIKNNSQAAIELALKQTNEFLAAAGYSMPKSLPAKTIYNMLGFLQEDSPLFKRLGQLAGTHTDKVMSALLEAVAFGYNPVKTARMFQNVMGGGLTDAMRMARTAQLYASREANRASYVANSDIIEGWEWITALDADVCMACAIEHGTIHPLDESMSSHYNCRCTSIPVVKGYEYNDQKGVDWFKGLDESQQEKMMGKQTFDVWKAGGFELEDMLGRRHDEVYGEMLSTTPLYELLGAEPPYK